MNYLFMFDSTMIAWEYAWSEEMSTHVLWRVNEHASDKRQGSALHYIDCADQAILAGSVHVISEKRHIGKISTTIVQFI